MDACRKTAVPRLLAMLCILAVFIPSFFMAGVGAAAVRAAVAGRGFAMIASLPAVEHARAGPLGLAAAPGTRARRGRVGSAASLYDTLPATPLSALRWPVACRVPRVAPALLLWSSCRGSAREIFPDVDAGQFQLRLRAPTGTRIERTELIALRALDVIKQRGRPGATSQITSATSASSRRATRSTPIYLWTSGPQEAVLQVALKPAAQPRGEALKERLRAELREANCPARELSFEPATSSTR